MLRMNGVSSLTFWFNERVIGFITSYSILLNNSPYGPKIGLRQAKPLSPYLFIPYSKHFFKFMGLRLPKAYFV
jgi:hypothetical protein